jgi:hypothetical protein
MMTAEYVMEMVLRVWVKFLVVWIQKPVIIILKQPLITEAVKKMIVPENVVVVL